MKKQWDRRNWISFESTDQALLQVAVGSCTYLEHVAHEVPALLNELKAFNQKGVITILARMQRAAPHLTARPEREDYCTLSTPSMTIAIANAMGDGWRINANQWETPAIEMLTLQALQKHSPDLIMRFNHKQSIRPQVNIGDVIATVQSWLAS